jgi:hypothetical protein
MTTKTNTYHTLLVLEDGVWAIGFGDYDRDVVKQEMEDDYADEKTKIITTSPDQITIQLTVGNLNREIAYEMNVDIAAKAVVAQSDGNPVLTGWNITDFAIQIHHAVGALGQTIHVCTIEDDIANRVREIA